MLKKYPDSTELVGEIWNFGKLHMNKFEDKDLRDLDIAHEPDLTPLVTASISREGQLAEANQTFYGLPKSSLAP